MNPKVQELIDLILKIPGDKIVTLSIQTVADKEVVQFDISKEGVIGYDPDHAQYFKFKLSSAFYSSGSIIIRAFTPLKVEREAPDGRKILIPIKKIYGAALSNDFWEGVSKEALKQVHNTDATTGERLSPEKEIIPSLYF